MGSLDKTKKRIQLWNKSLLHLLICFIMGLFTGLAPANTMSIFSGYGAPIPSVDVRLPASLPADQPMQNADNGGNMSEGPTKKKPSISSTKSELPLPMFINKKETGEITRKQLILITTVTFNNPLQGAMLRRLSNTLSLIPPPLLWIVIEPQSDSSEISQMLRNTGIMYRHLVSKENFTDPESERDYQRNLVLNHIEYHRLDGIVHFAELSHFYDLQFFEQVREIKTFGAWPIAKLSANRQRVVIDGPICSSYTVVGWHLQRSDQTSEISLQLSYFAFNSSILWNPERWGRTSLAQDTSQGSLDFIKQVVLHDQDEGKLKCLSSNNRKIKMWSLHLHV